MLIKTASGEWQAVQIQETTVTTPTTPTSNPIPAVVTKKAQTGTRKERTLPKIAPAGGGLITLNAAQLASAAQAVQTININGVQVQGVPVTITNAGGKWAHMLYTFRQKISLCDTFFKLSIGVDYKEVHPTNIFLLFIQCHVFPNLCYFVFLTRSWKYFTRFRGHP